MGYIRSFTFGKPQVPPVAVPPAQAGGATTEQKIARARRALERIRNVGKDRSERAGYRIDDMVDEAEEALRFLALPTAAP